MNKKIIDRAKEIYEAPIDIERAFEREPRKIITENLMPKQSWAHLGNYVRTDNMESQELVVEHGLGQAEY